MSRRLLTLLSASLLLSACGGDPSLKADKALRAGDYDKAARLYRDGAESSRDRAESQALHVKAGDVYELYLQKPNDAVREYRQAIASDPRTDSAFEARLKIASILEDDFKDPRKAIEAYHDAIANHPNAPDVDDARLRAAKDYLGLGAYDQARIEFQALLDADPQGAKAPEAAFEIADSWFVQEKIPEALQAYRSLLARYPDSSFAPQAQFGLARCLEESGHYSEAMAAYEKSLQTYPNPDVVKLRMDRLSQRRQALKPAPPGNFGIPAAAETEGD